MFWVLICKVQLNGCSYHVTNSFQSESILYSCLNVKELLARSRREMWNLSGCHWTQTQNHVSRKPTLNQPFGQTEEMIELCSEYLPVRFNWLYILIMSRTPFRVIPHSIVTSMSRTTLFERGALMWKLSDCNWTWTPNHLVRKQRLNYLAKLTKRKSCVMTTYLDDAIDCMFLSCHKHVSEWIHIL